MLVFEDIFWPFFSLVTLINFVFIKQQEWNGDTNIKKFNIISIVNIFFFQALNTYCYYLKKKEKKETKDSYSYFIKSKCYCVNAFQKTTKYQQNAIKTVINSK